MNNRRIIAAFSALSHPVRLDLFRGLCASFPGWTSAGELAEHHQVPPSTMTGHLQSLERAGLIRSERRSRHVMYAADSQGTQWLMEILVSDCLGGSDILAGQVEFPAARAS